MRVTAKVSRTDDYELAVEVPEVPGVVVQIRSLDEVRSVVAGAVARVTCVAVEDVDVTMDVDWDAEDWDPEEETAEILADPEVAESLRQAEEELARGEGIELTKAEALERWGRDR